MRLGKSTSFGIIYTVFSQGVLGAMSILTSIVLPKIMGPDQYGYFQKFAFYLMYINMLGIGFNDGITLIYAGKNNSDIPIMELRSAIRIHVIYSVVLSVFYSFITIIFFQKDMLLISVMLGLNVFPVIMFCTFSGVFLAENKGWLYNTYNMVQRALFCTLILALIFLKKCYYEYIITANTIANWVILFVSAYKCKDYIIGSRSSWASGFKEYRKLCASGIMIALSVSFMGLIPTLGRVIIEFNDSITNYGIYSFYISLLSIVLTFTNAIGIVAFPMLRNTNKNKLEQSYSYLEQVYRILAGSIYLFYPAIVLIIDNYMSKYSAGLVYVVFLIAICYPIGKIQMFIAPLYKTFRLEKRLFIINIASVAGTVIIDYLAYSIDRTPLSIAIGTALSCVCYYTILVIYAPKIPNSYGICFVFDWLTPLVFILVALFFNSFNFMIVYVIYISIVLWLCGKALRQRNEG